jgi:hypothetical protein
MERSPKDDRSDKQPRPQDTRGKPADPLSPHQKTSGGPAQQQQSPRAPEFAPGEDGECH